MHDGIRSGGVTPPWHDSAACDEYMEQAETSTAGAARAKKNTSRSKNNRPPRPPAGERARKLHRSEELGRHLDELGTTVAPHFVCMKTLYPSDVNKNQNRLLFSCKREFVENHPITALFAGNEKETFYVNQCLPGLRVTTFDGRGRQFRIRLRYLGSNGGYRLITGWHRFVLANGLAKPVMKGRGVDVELWAFRSRSLPGQPKLEGVEKHKQEVVEGLEDHPDGALGLLFIPYVDGVDISNVHRAAEEESDDEEMAEDEMDEEEMVAEVEREPAPPVHETKRQAAAKAAREEKRAADRARANRGKAMAREMTIDEVFEAAGQEVAESLIGLLTLSYRCSPVPMVDTKHIGVAPRCE
jgi:hypothetical protein